MAGLKWPAWKGWCEAISLRTRFENLRDRDLFLSWFELAVQFEIEFVFASDDGSGQG